MQDQKTDQHCKDNGGCNGAPGQLPGPSTAI